ncbi:hypothetical protein B0T13DRAFT_491838 [Neurospora crassa]|nr:hypothetical protein B0T13DRAFT_491838 [Neurospora crassa]
MPYTYITYLGASLGNMVTRGKIEASNRSDLSFFVSRSTKDPFPNYPFVSPRCEPVTPAPWPTLRKKKNNGDDQWAKSSFYLLSSLSKLQWLEVLCARWCGTGIPARFCDILQMICWLGRLMSLPILNPRALLR